MNLNEVQKRHLRNVSTADAAYRQAKREAAVRARVIALEEIASYQHALDREVRLAYEAGVPQRQIGIDGMGTTDGKTVKAALTRTEGVAHVESDPFSERYELTADELLKVTLTVDELEEAKRAVNFDETAAEAPNSALFAVDGARLEAVFGEVVADSFERNPVVFWAYKPAHEAEAVAWYNGRVEESAGVAA